MKKLIETIFSKNINLIYFSVILGLLLFLLSKNLGMFWDNILFGSKMGNQLYNNGLFNWIMPDEFDPGHPPFLGFVLALFWKIFGHKLWVAHLTMVPFVIGTIYQLIRFIECFIANKIHLFLTLIIILVDPTLSVALVLVNPEIIILFFFFLTVNSILTSNKALKLIGLVFLSIVSYRSMMLFAGIFLFEILHGLLLKKQNIKQLINFKFFAHYLITAIPGIFYVIWRLTMKGWFYTHPNSPWGSYSESPSVFGFFKNIALVIHRYIDFGRVFLFIFLFISLVVLWKQFSYNLKEKVRMLLLLAFSSVFFILLYCLLKTNPFGHRYFIVSYICLMLAAMLILKIVKSRKTIYIGLIFGLITGNLWLYPERIAQGWNATLGHIPYHSLRNKAIDFLDQDKIPIEEVASFFPNYKTFDEIDLSGDKRAFRKFNEQHNYVFYSNVYNLADEEYDMLERNYTEIKRFESYPVYISIFELKK